MPTPSKHANTPFHINFEQQKKRAKELCNDLQQGKQGAIDRFFRHHPKSSTLSADDVVANLSQLNEAQLVIAREFGLASWARLKRHALAMAAAQKAINNKAKSPDADMKTLHIRCGSDLQFTLPAAGFVGSFMEYSNPFCQGPVIEGPEMLSMRAKYLSSSYELHSYEETFTRLQKDETSLANAAHGYERVVLWFEHDSFDQLILIRILAHFAQNSAPEILELIDLNHFPGTIRFIGLGQLPPEAIRMLWAQRKPVSQAQLNQGQAAWQALRNTSPIDLWQIAYGPDSALPNLNNALQRHLQELPSTGNGLGLTEHYILEILGQGSTTAGEIFRDLMNGKEQIPWLGDLMFWQILRSMGQVENPVYTIRSQNGHSGTSKDPLAGECDWISSHPPRQISISDTGHAVLEGKIDWLSLNPKTRWLGGVEINTEHPCWRWDQSLKQPVLVA